VKQLFCSGYYPLINLPTWINVNISTLINTIYTNVIDVDRKNSIIINDIYNYKTSIAPISSKRIELSGTPGTRVGQTHSPGTLQGSSTIDQMEWKLRQDKQV